MLRIIFLFIYCFFCYGVFCMENISITVQSSEIKTLTAQVENDKEILLRNKLEDRNGVSTIHFNDKGVFSIILQKHFQKGKVQISDTDEENKDLCSLIVSKPDSKITLELVSDSDNVHSALYRQLARGGYAFILAIGNNDSVSIDSVKSRQFCKGQALALISQL